MIATRCSCGHRVTLTAWLSLSLLGEMGGTQIRNCPACVSTLGIDKDDLEALLLTSSLADIVVEFGAERMVAMVERCGLGKNEELLHVADELRERGRGGLASQVEAFRSERAERRRTLSGVPMPAIRPSLGTDKSASAPYSFVSTDRRAS